MHLTRGKDGKKSKPRPQKHEDEFCASGSVRNPTLNQTQSFLCDLCDLLFNPSYLFFAISPPLRLAVSLIILPFPAFPRDRGAPGVPTSHISPLTQLRHRLFHPPLPRLLRLCSLDAYHKRLFLAVG
jgi:hypothetical protein